MNEPVHPLARQIVADYGAPFLRYLLNVDDDTDILAELATVGPDLINLLITTRAQAPGDDGADFRAFTAPSVFTTVDGQSQSTLADTIRRERGGAIHVPPVSEDPVTHHITRIANDIWPALLFLEADGPRSPHGLTAGLSSIIRHPDIETACEAFLKDEVLGRLFPGHGSEQKTLEKLFEVSAEWILSTGQGGTRQLVMLLEHVIAAAGIQALVSDERISASGVVDRVKPAIATLRTLAKGQAAPVKLLVGFAGVATDGQELKFGPGILRSPSNAETKALGVGRISSILDTSVNLSLLSVTRSEGSMALEESLFMKAWEKHGPRLNEQARQTRSRIDRIRYSVLLASQDEETFGMSEVAQLIIDPTSPNLNPLWVKHTEPRAETVLSATAGTAASRFFDSVSELHPKSLDIAMKRILSSASERTDATDAFIDAVIVWENAFGVSTETTFRVTAAIAKILEPTNYDRRSILFKELKELYNARSKLVHGGTEIDDSKVWAYRQRSIEIALQVLRTLYTDRADLLSLRSDERGARVLLES